MIAVITADLINSAKYNAAVWMQVLKSSLAAWGSNPEDWEIYRGDEFQLRTHPEVALQMALELKARIKSIKDLDLRIAIGLGDESFKADRVSECNGTAYQRSGRMLDELKLKKKKIGIDTGAAKHNETLNLLLDLASDFIDGWSTVSAEIVALSLSQPDMTQAQLAEQLQIKQSAVSQRQKRARWSLLQELLYFYTKRLTEFNK